MTYLPVDLKLDDTQFPTAELKDVATQLRLIKGAYRRMYPELEYYAYKQTVTKVDNIGDISGAAGGTRFDTLYGEAVDPAMVDFQQPHDTNGSLKAAEPAVYDPIRGVHLRMKKENRWTGMQVPGEDAVREGKAWIPTIIADELGLTCHPGDYWLWNGRRHTVHSAYPVGWFKNTNVPLYIELAYTSTRRGA